MTLKPGATKMQILFALLSGMLFGIGLAVSGMANPARVLAFLDVAGKWDATLAFVMAGALAVAAPAFRVVLKRQGPWFAASFAVPARTDLEPSLALGAVLFGMGWGLAGLCPGPAIVDLVTGRGGVFLFVAAMFAGAIFHDSVDARIQGSRN